MAESFSLLAKAPPPRDLPIALARCIAAAPITSPRHALLARIFRQMQPSAQMRCKSELTRRRALLYGIHHASGACPDVVVVVA